MASIIKKPRNARSKRALEKRQPQIHEATKTALFVNASQSSALVQKSLNQLTALKKPHAVSFSKKKSNDVNPFVDAGSIEFWCAKNDTPLMLVGDSRKKRKDNLTWIRLFDGRVLDMIEMGIDAVKGTEEFQPPIRPDLGSRPIFHFAGPQFAADAASQYPAHAQLKSTLLDFYRGEETLENGIPIGGQVALQGGLQLVISVSALPSSQADERNGSGAGATLADLYAAGAASSSSAGPSSAAAVDSSAAGSKVQMRVYSLSVPPKTPARAVSSAFKLDECGPSFDFTLRRRQPSDLLLLSQSLKRAKTQAEKNRQGKSDTYKKNIETDDMGDMVGRVHVGKQDLSQLQTRKMKGLRSAAGDIEGEGLASDEDDMAPSDDDDEYMDLGGGDDDDALSEDGSSESDRLQMADLVAGRDGDDDDDDDDDDHAETPLPDTSGTRTAPTRKRGRK